MAVFRTAVNALATGCAVGAVTFTGFAVATNEPAYTPTTTPTVASEVPGTTEGDTIEAGRTLKVKREARETRPAADEATAPAPPGTPIVIELPTIGAAIPVVTTKTTDGVFLVPDNIAEVGWDRGTQRPGSAHGTTLMAGHLDDAYGNDGALHDLGEVAAGDPLTVATATGDITYRVARVRTYDKDGLPAAVVATTGPHRVALVTCGGPLVRGEDGLLHYRDNLIVWAVPTERGQS